MEPVLMKIFMDDFIETKLPNNSFKITHKDIEKPRELTPPEKIAFDRKQRLLQERAEVRQETCWRYQCERKAAIWIREVGFDFKGDKADPLKHIAITSADYPGPVPGFCTFCLGYGPKELAETIYFDRPEIYWGVRPARWWVSFTDSTRQGGSCIELNERLGLPIYQEEHV